MDVDGTPLPNDLPVIERRAVRVVVTDAADRVLLFHTKINEPFELWS